MHSETMVITSGEVEVSSAEDSVRTRALVASSAVFSVSASIGWKICGRSQHRGEPIQGRNLGQLTSILTASHIVLPNFRATAGP